MRPTTGFGPEHWRPGMSIILQWWRSGSALAHGYWGTPRWLTTAKQLWGVLFVLKLSLNRGEVNICLADFGRGILKSLSSSEKYNYLKDSIEAIELSIQKGVSSRKNGAAGLGLTFIHDFLKLNEGRIHIISSSSVSTPPVCSASKRITSARVTRSIGSVSRRNRPLQVAGW